MVYIKVVRKSTAIALGSAVFFIIVFSMLLAFSPEEELVPVSAETADEWQPVLLSLFVQRNECVLSGDLDSLKTIFAADESKGRWAYENEVLRSQYLRSWAAKQGAAILRIKSSIKILRSKAVGRGYAFYLLANHEFSYSYSNETDNTNRFTICTYHSIDLIPGTPEGTWIISREWYDDPLSNTFSEYKSGEDIAQYILAALPKELSEMKENRILAVDYADTYWGRSIGETPGTGYNREYSDYNSLGGDCANFASQVLYAGGFKKNSTWNYKAGKGSWSWIKARGLKDYLVYNGKGSVVAKGKYEDVYKYAYELLPGDMVFYAKKGKVTHVSVVTGLDSKGCPLVNSHNLDRYRVPWDIGWNQDNITFYLVRVHY